MSVTIGAAAILASLAAPARAQSVPALNGGTDIWVTTGDGDEQYGTVVTVSSTELVLRIDGTVQSIAIRDLRRIEGRDGLGNGIRNGGFVGAAILGGLGVVLSYALCDIPDSCLSHDVGPIALLAGIGAGTGAAAGAVIDRAIEGRRVLYASSGAPFALEVVPTPGGHAVVARAFLRW